MIAFLALTLAATPVSLQLDLSKQTREKAGVRLEETIRQRLIEDGFELSSPAKIVLRVDELHGVFRLTAVITNREPVTREVALTGNEWRDELALEIAQRLVALAHEVEPPPKKKMVYDFSENSDESTPPDPPDPEPKPEDDPIAAADQAPLPVGHSRGSTLQVGAGLRVGIGIRFPGFDPAFAFHGVLVTGVVEPIVLTGLTLAPNPFLFVAEIPVLAGVRLRTAPRNAPFAVMPEALIGARVHTFGATELDESGVRVDFMGTIGATASFNLGAVRLGLRAGLELSAGREHFLGSLVIWRRSPVTLSLQLVIERG